MQGLPEPSDPFEGSTLGTRAAEHERRDAERDGERDAELIDGCSNMSCVRPRPSVAIHLKRYAT